MILSAPLPWLFKLCKSIKKGHQDHLHMSIHLYVCESVTATAIDQVWFNLGLYDTFKVLHHVTLANIKAGFG